MDERRLSAAERGYDHKWRRFRNRYLRAHPICDLCGQPSEVPDHYPQSRKELLAAGITNPDQDCYVRPLCTRCHNSETNRNQGREPRRRQPEPHPGEVRSR